MTKEKAKEKKDVGRTKELIETVKAILNNIDVEEARHKKTVFEVYDRLASQGYFLKRTYSELYSSIKYDFDYNYARFSVPVIRKIVLNKEFRDKINEIRSLLKGNSVYLILVSSYDNFMRSINSIECSEIQKYINCNIAKQLNAVIEKKETTISTSIRLYIKLEDNILLQVCKYLKKHRII